jgi:hypothetical protein
VYYWRVRAQDAANNWSDWSCTDTVTLTILNWPKNAQHLTDTTPTLKWKSAGYGVLYDVQVDEAGGNFSGDLPFSYNGTARSATTPELGGGDYQWRARVNGGAWTPVWTFTITPPTTIAPRLTTPANYAKLDTTAPAFEWQTVPGGVQYQIQIASNSSFKTPVQDVTLDPDDLDYTAEALADGGKYFWRVRALNGEGVAGAWSAKWQFTLNQLVKPVLSGPPSGMSTSDTAPQLSWSGLPDAQSYEIQIDMDKKFGTPDQLLTTVDTTVTPTPDLPDGKYFWRVRAVNEFEVTGLWSAAWTFTVDTTGPDQPVLRRPADHAGTRDTTPTLVWKSARTAKQYRLQVADDANFTSAPIDVTVGGTSYTLPADQALGYGLHYWRVKAIDALGNEGDWSTPFQFALTAMTSPKDGTTTTNPRPTFAWAAVTGALSYHFELDDDPDFTVPLAGEYEGPNRSYVPPVVLGAGAYYWRVSVDGGDPMPAWTLVISPAKPAKPALSTPANKTLTNDNTPTFTWQAVLYGTSYQLQVDNNSDFSSPEQDVRLDTEPWSYVADALPDGKYYWRVRAFNADTAPGPWSAKWTLTIDTVAPPVPEPLAPIDDAASTNRMLRLTWSKVDGAAAYELQLDPTPSFPLPVISTGSRTSYTPPTPLSRGIYWWQVRALDKAGNPSAWSAPRAFEIVAGVTAPAVEPPTPLPTELPAPAVEPIIEPAVEPTAQPTEEPTAEPTVEPTGEPTVEPPVLPTATPLPVLLPVIDGFDTDTDWTASGAWRYDIQNTHNGGGWFADSATRGQSSTLTADTNIDLRMAQNPELTFWQRAILSSADRIALDLSVDGGLSWTAVDQQSGASIEWSPRTVSLAAVRGQIVRLRFRLDTLGTIAEGEITAGWWIDDLTVQEVTVIPPTDTLAPTEEATATSLPTATPTEIPTAIPLPTDTPTPIPLPTDTPVPTFTPTLPSTATPLPTATLQPEVQEPPQDPVVTPDNE